MIRTEGAASEILLIPCDDELRAGLGASCCEIRIFEVSAVRSPQRASKCVPRHQREFKELFDRFKKRARVDAMSRRGYVPARRDRCRCDEAARGSTIYVSDQLQSHRMVCSAGHRGINDDVRIEEDAHGPEGSA